MKNVLTKQSKRIHPHTHTACLPYSAFQFARIAFCVAYLFGHAAYRIPIEFIIETFNQCDDDDVQFQQYRSLERNNTWNTNPKTIPSPFSRITHAFSFSRWTNSSSSTRLSKPSGTRQKLSLRRAISLFSSSVSGPLP